MADSYCTSGETGQRVAQLRTQMRMSQQQLASRLDVTQSTISRIEAGERALTVGELGRLTQVFGVTVGALLWRDGSGLVALRALAGGDSSGVQESLQLFRELIGDYLGARALAG